MSTAFHHGFHFNDETHFYECAAQEDFFYNNNMKIGEKIKELRIEHGFSQAMLAKQIGASQKAVDYWERGVNEPKASYVIALVRFFGISFDEFFYEVN